jgi:hypothetical protein
MSTATINLDRLLEPFVSCLTPEVAAKIADSRADEETQGRIDFLADRSNEGQLTSDEREEYEGYLHAIDVITVRQAKARFLLRNPPS